MATNIDGKPSGGGSEFRREREMYRYLPPFAASYLPQYHRDGDNSAILSSPPSEAYSSVDRALNAFAQLGALRLRTKRAMISLIDRKYQYILAEATQTLSSQCDNVHDVGDSLWLGVRTIPRDEGFCAAAIITPPLSRDDCTDDHRRALAPRIINDLAVDETFKDRSYVLSGKIRFYAGVPIRSRHGFDIGSYCVLDDNPRAGVSVAELEFLQDMAHTVMDHLEYVAERRDYQRGEKMVKGLGLFVEGHSSISDWWVRTRDERRPVHHRKVNRKHSVEASADAQELDLPKSNNTSGAGDTAPERSKSPESRPSLPLPEEDSTTFSKFFSGNSSRRPSTDSLNPAHEVDQSSTKSQPVSPRAIARPSSSRPVSPLRIHSLKELRRESFAIPTDVAAPSADSPELAPGPSIERQDSDIDEGIKEMLSRASNLIRESTDVDGVIFFDAKHSSFGSQRLKSSLTDADSKTTTEGSLTTSSSENESKSSSQQGPSDSNSDQRPHGKATPTKQRTCKVLAYSSVPLSSLHGQDCLPSHLTVTESFVTKLFKRYPHGNIFMFDEDGAMSSGEDEVKQAEVAGEISVVAGEKTRKKSSRILEGETILKIFPGARSVLTLPLWDAHRERWFASAMLWTSDPVRVLSSKDDLNYMAAFGNSIMAEVSRLDAIVADHTKTTLISSISHELRSPLHGVLGSIELLQDTSATEYQRDVFDTIGHCSMTLLDTLNNVLDYAKINNFTTAQKSEQKAIRKSSRSRKAIPAEKFRIYGTISLTSDLDLASITEEVIGGIYAGHEYTLRSKSYASGADVDYHISSDRSVQARPDNSPLLVILDVDKKSNWMFCTQPGAWKRILMNLFGNALKFTTSGLVKVQLEYKDATQHKLRLNQAFVTITITDTGKGIAPDFLNGHIFTPFSQEDTLTPGAGLGLSIVRQIVGALDGKLEISSVQGYGTVAKARLKLEKSRSPVNHAVQCPENIRRAKGYTNGLELVLVGLEDTTTPENETTKQSEVPSGTRITKQPNTHAAISSTISRISKNWFGLRTSKASGFDGLGDLFLTTSENFAILEQEWQQHSSLSGDFSKRHIIVLQNNTFPEDKARSRKNKNIHFLSNPIGPRKLADCFLSIFESSISSDANKDSPEAYDTTSTPASLGVNMPTSKPDHILSIQNLDLSASPTSTDEVAKPASTEQATNEPAILIVEDNPINMKILAACISKLQARFHTAKDGQQAVDHYKSAPRKPDLIFMDISMPIMNGFEATRHIRAFERENRLSASIIVAVTGLASDESQREAYNSGINLFLSKPVPLREMKKIVGEWRTRLE